LDAATQSLLATSLVSVYAALLAVGAVSTAVRVAQFRRTGRRPPRLLKRDLALLSGHSVALAAVLVPRALGILDAVDGSAVWWVLVGGGPIVAITVYVYYELFVIGH